MESNKEFINQEYVNSSIQDYGFSESTIQLINNFTNDILNGKSNLTKFNQKEHAGLCCAGEVLIRAYIVCSYARTSLTASRNASESKNFVSNWEIDVLQEKLVQQWAERVNYWFPHAEEDIESEYGRMIAQGAEAKVYFKSNDTSVIKIRASIYATLERAFESIALHNSLFPEAPMHVIGFTRDKDGLFRTIITQPYIDCERLATKEEIDLIVENNGFKDNHDGKGINYISDRLHLEDMHPANVFIDSISSKPVCIDCIVKFRRDL